MKYFMPTYHEIGSQNSVYTLCLQLALASMAVKVFQLVISPSDSSSPIHPPKGHYCNFSKASMFHSCFKFLNIEQRISKRKPKAPLA